MTSKLQTGVERPASPGLPLLGKRAHVRVLLPPSVRLYARVRHAGSTAAGARGMVGDLGAGGLALRLTEGLRFEIPGEGQEVHLELDYEGGEAQTRGRVVRAASQQLSVAFPDIARDRDVNVELFALIARIVTRHVEHLDRGRFAAALRARLEHEHFQGAGYLDVRTAPTWWQIVFLDYLIAWSAAGGVVTGAVDRALVADPLRLAPSAHLHDTPWPSLRKTAALVATRCAGALPEHASAFALIARTV